MSIRLADRSFQYPVGIAKNMLVEVGKFTFPADFIILEMEEDSKVPLILGRPFLHTADALVQVKHEQLNLGVGNERMIFNINSAIKHSYSNDDTCFSIDVIDEIVEEDFDALLDEAMTADENSDFESDTEDPPFKKITINTDYKIKTTLEEPLTDLELKTLPDNLEYVFLEEPSFLPIIISSQLFKEKKNKLVSVLKKHKQAFAWKTTNISSICPLFCKYKIQFLDDKKPVVQKLTRCMLEIFHDMIEELVKVFMDDFSVFRNSFDTCLNNLDKMLQHCKDTHLVLNWEKCHFIIKEGIMLGHKVSSAGLEVDKAKIDVILKLSPPTNIKDTPFEFDDECQKAFELLKEKLTCAPMIVSPNWNLPFELMCDASDFIVGAILEPDIEIKDRPGTENVAADHLSRIENDEKRDDGEVDDNFPGETLMEINTKNEPWFADFANYLVGGTLPFQNMLRRYDQTLYIWTRNSTILDQCHHGPAGGHYKPNITAKKVLDSGFSIIIKEDHTLVCLCEACQKTGNISKRDEMPLNNIQVCEIFDIRGIDFMGPFPRSYKFEYILVAVDYVSKWVKPQALPTNDARVVVTFLKKLFFCFGMPKGLISNRDNPAIWSRKLDDALWAFRTTYKTPTGTTPYKLIYGKNCHLPFEIDHHAYWALKNCNPDLIAAGEKRMF
ncbi:reverse transcriptase domain-containing protein [Tanacetum coccineum]